MRITGILLSALYPLLSINIALSCPQLEGKYDCGASSILQVTQTQEGDFYSYKFHYFSQEPTLIITDNISRSDGSSGLSFHTARCVGDVLEWKMTPIPLNTEEDVKSETKLTKPPDILMKKLGITSPEAYAKYEEQQNKKHLNFSKVTIFYSFKNNTLQRRIQTIISQSSVTVDNRFDVGQSIVDLASRLSGSSSDEVAQKTAARKVKTERRNIVLNEDYPCDLMEE